MTKRTLHTNILTLLLLMLHTATWAQYDLLSSKKGVVKDGYDFWV